MEDISYQRKNTKKVFFSGVIALSVASITVKVLGLLFKIPIANILSAESLESGVGLGYFSSAYTVYTWLFMVATSGLPTGISIAISECRAEGWRSGIERLFRKTRRLFLLIGLCLFLLLFFFSRGIAFLIGNSESALSMAVIAPTLLFISVSSVYRGFFYGHQVMLPPALSEVVEAFGKLFFGTAGAYYAYVKGESAEVVAAFAVLGVTLGVFLGMMFLIIMKWRYDRKGKFSLLSEEKEPPEDKKMRVTRVLRLSVPITLASSVMSLTGLIDVATMMSRLQSIGYSASEASALYGTYSMLAVPLYNLPVVLLSPLISSVIPLLAARFVRGEALSVKRMVESVLRIVSLFIIPASLGVSLFSYEILSLFYDENASAIAAPLLSVLASATFFLGLLTVTNAILQANRLAGKTVVSMSIGALVKLVFGFFLVGNADIGMYGVPISTVLCYLVILVIDLALLAKHLSVVPRFFQTFIRPFCIAAVSVLLGRFFIYPSVSSVAPMFVATVLSISAVAVIYLLLLLFCRAVSGSDVLLLPGGKKIQKVLQKKKLLSED